MKKTLTLLAAALCYQLASAQIGWMATFESHDLQQADTFYNGADSAESFKSGRASFAINYNPAWMSWDGISVSNMKDTSTKGYVNQYSAVSGSGVNHSKNYAVAHKKATVVLDKQQVVKGMYINNGTYPALSMRDGDQFAKKFGGADGMYPDYLKVIATGYVGSSTSGTEEFYLADYRFADQSKDYIVSNWTHWNLELLGDVDSIIFTMESSDTGQFGMNTPAYFCFDNFNADSLENSHVISNLDFDYKVEVDSFLNGSTHDGGFAYNSLLFENDYNKQWKSWSGWSISSMTDTTDAAYNNQYSCIAGSGMDKSKTYITGYNSASILFPYLSEAHFNNTVSRDFVVGINNSTYGYKTMKNGNQFAKKFGGPSGNDKDYLVVKVVGTMYSGEKSDTLRHYLADFRSDNNAMDYIQKDWDYWDLSDIIFNRPIVRLDFWVEGSDTGQYGLNTPAYFCLDNIFPLTGSVMDVKDISVGLYPNPTHNVLNIKTKGEIEKVSIVDVLGNTKMVQVNNTPMIDVSALEKGIYFVQVQTTEGFATKQFVKK